MQASIELPRPIAEILKEQFLGGSYLKLDVTALKTGRTKSTQDKMKAGWFWPMLGKHCDFVFNSAASRGRRVVEQLLMGFSGTLQADGYEVYARHRTDHENINHALCWRYTRRFFLKAKPSHPKLVKQITGTIAVLYRIERQSRESGADNRQILKLRGRRSPRRVDKIFKWIDTQIQHVELTPKDRSWQRVELTTFILTIIW